MSLNLEIVTPEKRVYNESVSTVVLPTTEGEIGVFEGHIPLIASLKPGELRVLREGQDEYLAVDKGFAQVFGDKISVLTEAAIDIQEIDIDAAQKARQKAEEELSHAQNNEGFDPAELERLEAQARFAVIQELVKKNRT